MRNATSFATGDAPSARPSMAAALLLAGCDIPGLEARQFRDCPDGMVTPAADGSRPRRQDAMPTKRSAG